MEDFLATLDRIFKGAAIVDPALVQELLAARIVAVRGLSRWARPPS